MIDISPLITQLLGLWWIIPLLFLTALIKSPWFKGKAGETFVRISARLALPRETYHPVHDVTLPTPDGTTQIDHLFVSQYGIFVVETKNMKGWIYGQERQAQWTQAIFKKRFKFQNPLRQNYKHVQSLASALALPSEVFMSVIVFTGDSTFKTTMPGNVMRVGRYARYIKSFRNTVLTSTQVAKAVSDIETMRLAPTFSTDRAHVKQLKERHNKPANNGCPKCGNPMVERTTKKGQKAGTRFWGCSSYPKCRGIKSIS